MPPGIHPSYPKKYLTNKSVEKEGITETVLTNTLVTRNWIVQVIVLVILTCWLNHVTLVGGSHQKPVTDTVCLIIAYWLGKYRWKRALTFVWTVAMISMYILGKNNNEALQCQLLVLIFLHCMLTHKCQLNHYRCAFPVSKMQLRKQRHEAVFTDLRNRWGSAVQYTVRVVNVSPNVHTGNTWVFRVSFL